jgi:curved DNA-binding protein CbpA
MERPFSLYSVLRVPPGAPPAAIEAAYRSLMKRHHPDHAGAGSSERAAEINAAFSVLRDPARRADYDRGEHKRQRALEGAAFARWARRRRVVRFGALTAAALLVGAGLPLALNWYNGGIVPERSAAILVAAPAKAAVPEAPAAKTAAESDPDPIERVADFLSAAAKRRPVAVEAPPKRSELAEAPAASARPPESRSMMRRAAPPSPSHQRQPGRAEERDFLEREGFIY